MTVTHAIFTEQVAQVLREIQRQQQTGLLQIDYVGEQNIERGEIFFQGGSTVFARTEQQVGEPAFWHIMSWDKVYCSFREGFPSLLWQSGFAESVLGQSTPRTGPLAAVVQTEEPHTPPEGVPLIPQEKRPQNRQIAPPAQSQRAQLSPNQEGIHLGVQSVFRILPKAHQENALSQIGRHERIVFMLLDGRRSLQDVAQLVHRSELSIAHTLARFLRSGYIECVEP